MDQVTRFHQSSCAMMVIIINYAHMNDTVRQSADDHWKIAIHWHVVDGWSHTLPGVNARLAQHCMRY